MTYTPHTVVKPEVLAKTALGFLDAEVIVANTFTKKGVDEFKGARDDSVSFKVPGILPFHRYAWRNDRSNPIKMDQFTERTITVAFGDNLVSGVELTDEQKDFDLIGWSSVLEMQARAIGRGLENMAVNTLEDAPYEVAVPWDASNIRGSLIKARNVMNRLRVPNEQRVLIVGTDVEQEILLDESLNLAQFIGEGIAVNSLRNATIGVLYGFQVVVSQEIDPRGAYAFVRSAFAMLTAAPSKPESIKFGATAAYNGIALRWLRQYAATHLVEQSVVNTYAGFQHVTDLLRYTPRRADGASDTNEAISKDAHFVRAIKFDSTVTDVEIGNAELAAIYERTAPAGHTAGPEAQASKAYPGTKTKATAPGGGPAEDDDTP